MSILISLVALMYLAYRGYSVLVLAPLLALLAVLLGGDTRLLAMYTQVFMTGLRKLLIKYFPLFLLGAIFGRLISNSESESIDCARDRRADGAHRAVMALVLSCAILTYGGVSVFVVAFAAYPVGAALPREAEMPKRLIPGALVLGSATFTMTALPGTPAMQKRNSPCPTSAPMRSPPPDQACWWGWSSSPVACGGSRVAPCVARAAGEGYGHHHVELATQHTASANGNYRLRAARRVDAPSFLTAILPVALVIGLNLAFTRWIIPSMDSSSASPNRSSAR